MVFILDQFLKKGFILEGALDGFRFLKRRAGGSARLDELFRRKGVVDDLFNLKKRSKVF